MLQRLSQETNKQNPPKTQSPSWWILLYFYGNEDLTKGLETLSQVLYPWNLSQSFDGFLTNVFISLVFDSFIYVCNRSVHTLCSQSLFYYPKSQLLPISPQPTFLPICSRFGFKPTRFNQRHIHGPDPGAMGNSQWLHRWRQWFSLL